MKTEISVGGHGRAIFSDGELPEARYPVEAMLTGLSPAVPQLLVRRVAPIEVSLPKGARALYGLLGATFEPLESDSLRVDVAVSATGTRALYRSAIAVASEVTLVGLIAAYGEAVLSGATSKASHHANRPPSGRLLFDAAAYGLVGSSVRMFEFLGQLLTRVLFDDVRVAADVALALDCLAP